MGWPPAFLKPSGWQQMDVTSQHLRFLSSRQQGAIGSIVEENDLSLTKLRCSPHARAACFLPAYNLVNNQGSSTLLTHSRLSEFYLKVSPWLHTPEDGDSVSRRLRRGLCCGADCLKSYLPEYSWV